MRLLRPTPIGFASRASSFACEAIRLSLEIIGEKRVASRHIERVSWASCSMSVFDERSFASDLMVGRSRPAGSRQGHPMRVANGIP